MLRCRRAISLGCRTIWIYGYAISLCRRAIPLDRRTIRVDRYAISLHSYAILHRRRAIRLYCRTILHDSNVRSLDSKDDRLVQEYKSLDGHHNCFVGQETCRRRWNDYWRDRDASVEQKKIKEINPAIYVVNSKALFDALKKITSDNKQKEYYLTDIFNFIPSDKVGTVIAGDENEVKGINSLDQLREIKSFL